MILLTHAHLDHSGYIPRLVKQGFKGDILCTPATRDLCEILLPDSGYLQEEEAGYANKKGYSKHHPALPLYNVEDAKNCLKQFKTTDFRKKNSLPSYLSAEFLPAGHILGASMIRLSNGKRTIGFTGDLGRPNDPIMKAPSHFGEIDELVMESTYGDRKHERIDPLEQIEQIVNRTLKRKGILLIPAFAVGRAQTLMYLLSVLRSQKRIPEVPTYLNSPMACDVTEIFSKEHESLKLSREECQQMCSVAQYVNSVEESKLLNQRSGPMIIISASGMATGGRVLHHLKAFLPDEKNTVLFTGFQAAGTRGEALVHGKKEIKIHGQYWPVRAEVLNLHNLSAHSDYEESISWLGDFQKRPQRIFITHGEIESARSLKEKIEKKFHWSCIIPKYLDQFDL